MSELNSKSTSTVPVVSVNQTPVKERIESIENKDRTRDLSFADTFRPIYYYSRVFGLMPFSIVCDSNGEPQEPRIGVLNFLWFITSMCLYLSMAYYSFIDMNVTRDDSLPYAFILAGFIMQIFRLVFGALIILIDMCKRYKLVDILKKLNIFSKEVSDHIL